MVTTAAFWLYLAFVASQFAWASLMTPLYHQAFPTGHSRFLTLTPLEIMLYVGLPRLYPLPVLWRMAPTLTLTLTNTLTLTVIVTVTVTVTLAQALTLTVTLTLN